LYKIACGPGETFAKPPIGGDNLIDPEEFLISFTVNSKNPIAINRVFVEE